MKQDSQPTRVVFRYYKPTRDFQGNRTSHCGEVIALFYEEPGTSNPLTCSSYMHVGQHGAADTLGVVRDTRPAKPEEYAALKAELEGSPYGYRLEVHQRIPRDATEKRRKSLEAIQ